MIAHRKLLVFLILCVMLALLAGCNPSDEEFVTDLVLSWVEKNWTGGLMNVVTGSSGDPEVDAILAAKEVLDNLAAADKLMNEGRKERNGDKMDQAIEKRPDDWTYRFARAALALENNDYNTYANHHNAAWNTSDEQNADEGWALNELIDELEDVDNRLSKGTREGEGGFANADHCRAVYNELGTAYRSRAELTDSAADHARADSYFAQAKLCR